MNKKNTIILYKNQLRLIRNSEIAFKNSELNDYLYKFSNSIKKQDIDKIKEINKEIYLLLSNREIVEDIIKTSSSEWIQDKPIGEEIIPCELCGNVKSKKKFLIKNKKTLRVMKVGSECIEKFPDINRPIKGEKLDNLHTLDMDSYKRLIKFNERFNGGKDIINDWINEYDSYDITFPIDIIKRYRQLIKDSKKFYNDFKYKKIKETDLEKFKFYIKESQRLKIIYNEFYLKNKDNRYLCDKNIEKFLDDNKMQVTKEHILSNNALIHRSIRKSIYEISFIKRFLKEINEFFYGFNIHNIKINDNFISGDIECNRFNSIKVFITLKNFMENFDNVLDGEFKNYNREGLISQISIEKEFNNINEFINIISSFTKKYSFKCDYDLFARNCISVYDYRGKKYSLVEINKFIELREIFICNNEESIKRINIFISNIEKWITKEDKKKYDIGKIDKVWDI